MYHHEVIYRSKRLFTARRLLHFSITTYYTSRSAKQGQGQQVKGSIINWSEPIRNKISIRGIIIVQCSYWSHLPLGQPELWEISKVNILTYHTGRLASHSHERYQRSIYLLIIPAAWPIRAMKNIKDQYILTYHTGRLASQSHENYQRSIYTYLSHRPLGQLEPRRAMRNIKNQYTYHTGCLATQSCEKYQKVNILTYHTGRLSNQSHARYQMSAYLLIASAVWPIRAMRNVKRSINLRIAPAAWPIRARDRAKESSSMTTAQCTLWNLRTK